MMQEGYRRELIYLTFGNRRLTFKQLMKELPEKPANEVQIRNALAKMCRMHLVHKEKLEGTTKVFWLSDYALKHYRRLNAEVQKRKSQY